MTLSGRRSTHWNAAQGYGWSDLWRAACLLATLCACSPQAGQPVPPDAVTAGDSVWVDTAIVDASGGTVVVSVPPRRPRRNDMAAPRPTGFDEPVRPEDVAVEEALVDVDEDVLPEDPTIPDEANEADVLEQREEVPEDEDEELRDT